jgi:hypothetical protein
MRLLRLYLTAVILVASAAKCSAQCQVNGPDTSYTRDPTITGYDSQFYGDVPSWVRITRVVGPGTSAELDPYGGLLNWQTMQQSGVLGPTAYVRVSGFMALTSAFWAYATLGGTPTAAEARITFTINGNPIGKEYILYSSMSGSTPGPAVSFADCISIRSQFLRYGRRLDTGGACPSQTLPIRQGETTCPGINEVEATIRVRVGPTSIMTGPGAGLLSIPFADLAVSPQELIDTINLSGSVTRVNFTAMAPVIMVHGIRATSQWFLNYTSSPAGGNTIPYHGTTYNNLWFNSPFVTAKAPYQAIDFNEGGIPQGGANLASNGAFPGTITHPIPDAAAGFGAKRVHIVAHSMGGLWSRAFLDQQLANLPSPLGVLSLTTLDTPHHGSYNADLVALSRASLYQLGRHVTPSQAGIATMAPYSPGTPDLTTWTTAAFNSSNHLPNSTTVGGFSRPIGYFSISADANLDGSCVNGTVPCYSTNLPTITPYASAPPAPDESEGYEWPDPDIVNLFQSMTAALQVNTGQMMYRDMFRFKTVTLVKCNLGLQYCLKNVDADGTQLNDFNVTVQSARYTPPPPNVGFTELTSLKHNHTTIGKSITLTDAPVVVLGNLLAVEQALH